jgi:hypothetical protein
MPSTVIEQFRYDAGSRKLVMKFRPSGQRYVYLDVPPETYQGLLSASSRGAYFNAHIRDHFPFRRLDEPRTMAS